MIGIGRDCGRQGAAHDLGVVELRIARIRAGHKHSANCIACLVGKTSFPRLKKARVLVKQRRKNGTDHEIFDGPVGKGRGETFAITRGALAKSGLTIFRLADTCQKPVPGVLNVIERAASHDTELLFCGERRNLPGVFQTQEVRQGIEKAIVRSSCDLAWSAASTRDGTGRTSLLSSRGAGFRRWFGFILAV